MVKKPGTTIFSGGQTGVDRAALDWAIEKGWPHAGFCPLGRIAEDGTIPERYLLTESSSSSYSVRTRLNVMHCEATLVLSPQPTSGGTALTQKYAIETGKPFFTLSPESKALHFEEFSLFLARERPSSLNVAGPRLSEWERGPDFARQALDATVGNPKLI